MPISAPKNNGFMYPTYMTARCPSFHACMVCQSCTHYNRHDIACVICESRKPSDWRCIHTDEKGDEVQAAVRIVNEALKMNIYDPDNPAGEVNAPTAHELERHEALTKISQAFKITEE